MSNICDTMIIIYGNDEPLKKIQRLIDIVRKETKVHQVWTGNILCKLHGREYNDYDFVKTILKDARSYVDICDKYPNKLVIELEDAWCPHVKFWIELIKSFDDGSLTLTYSSIEEGMEVFLTNDETLVGERVFEDDYVEDQVECLKSDDETEEEIRKRYSNYVYEYFSELDCI